MSHGTSRQKIFQAVLVGIGDAQQRYRAGTTRAVDTMPEYLLGIGVADSIYRLAQPCDVSIELRDDEEPAKPAAKGGRDAMRYGVRVRARAGDIIAAIEVHAARAGSIPRLDADLSDLAAAIMYKPYKSKLAYGMVGILLSAASPAALERRAQALIDEFDALEVRAGIRRDYLLGESRVDGERAWQAVVLGLSRPAQGNQPPARLQARKA